MYDPNVTINLPAGKGQEMSTLYFQTCVNWVYENICRPLGDTDIKSGKFYISSYGNNEYYSGTSAYQGNIDLRPSAARSQYPAGYEGMSDDQIIELEKTRFMKEVMPGKTLHTPLRRKTHRRTLCALHHQLQRILRKQGNDSLHSRV